MTDMVLSVEAMMEASGLVEELLKHLLGGFHPQSTDEADPLPRQTLNGVRANSPHSR